MEAFVSDMGERVMSLEGLEAQLDDDVEEEKEEEEEIQPENIPHESPSDQQQAQQQPPQGNAGNCICPYGKCIFIGCIRDLSSNQIKSKEWVKLMYHDLEIIGFHWSNILCQKFQNWLIVFGLA